MEKGDISMTIQNQFKKALAFCLACLLLCGLALPCRAADYTPLAEELQELGLFLGTDEGFALDKTQFRQLFLNLIRNAAEAMPSGGIIKIFLSFDGAFLTIRVQDNGCGIPAEYLPTLFDLFVTYKKNGTGLGLAICQEIVASHNGTISVSSVPGEGSTFTVVFPFS